MEIENLVKDAMPFLKWVAEWNQDLPALDLEAEIKDPASVAVLSVDLINGFCYTGPLSSPRVASIVPPIVRLFKRAYDLGVRHFILPQDTHEQNAVEFENFAPHAVKDSKESQTVPELKALSFFDQFTVIPKNSISSSIETQLPAWLDEHPEVNTFIVVGDCTDFCTYQLAMYLRLRANAKQHADTRVIVPADSVDTFDMSVETAQELGIMPHHGELLHLIYLYSMALNGVEVVASIN